jgi:hypothetical protein
MEEPKRPMPFMLITEGRKPMVPDPALRPVEV